MTRLVRVKKGNMTYQLARYWVDVGGPRPGTAELSSAPAESVRLFRILQGGLQAGPESPWEPEPPLVQTDEERGRVWVGLLQPLVLRQPRWPRAPLRLHWRHLAGGSQQFPLQKCTNHSRALQTPGETGHCPEVRRYQSKLEGCNKVEKKKGERGKSRLRLEVLLTERTFNYINFSEK